MSTVDIQTGQLAPSLIARQTHLDLLGITQWYSRYRLPHAGKTPEALLARPCDVKAELITENPNLFSQEQNEKPHLPLDYIGKLGLDKVAEQLGPADISLTSQVVQNRSAFSDLSNPENDLKLSLCMVSVGRGLIFYECQASERQINEHNFLKAFLKFVSNDMNEVFHASFFDWPVFTSAVVRSEQSRYLKDAITRWAGKSDWTSVNYVFYFGYHFDALEQWLLDIKIACDSECVFVPIRISIDEILSAPIKKRGLWESIASLTQK